MHSFPLTNLRINKLLYFIHGWSLTSRAHGLVRNHFVAWQHGPVVTSVFDAFKIYGDQKIEKPATYLDYSSGELRIIGYDDISAEDTDLIIRIFLAYDICKTGQLVDMTHEENGPWNVIFAGWSNKRRLNARIPNDLIRDYFFKQAGGKVRH